jgi:RNA polymerase sigma-70 factor, ECF subfamily
VEIEDLFRELYPSLRRYLYRLTRDADMAEDAAQEAFVRLAAAGRFMDRPKAWLFTTGTNLVRENARSSSRRERLLSANPVLPAELPRPDEEALRDESVRRVRRVLERLTPRESQLLLMREEGFKHPEIAAAMGIAAGSVGTLLARAGKRFAELYEIEEEG